MNNDLISREVLKKAIFEHCRSETECLNHFWYDENIISLIDNAPTVDIPTELCKSCRFLKDCETCEEKLRPQGELAEIKHRLNLLIGVLYSNQAISNSDIEYIECSIKKLMKGGTE